jgi:ATP-binding cassette subfamily B protein
MASAFSEASQSALMFNRTLVENVRYGSPHASSDDLRDALQAARALSLVAELPKGLETKVGERGSNISTGERQRLAIARALLKRAPLLILDEATSSVDALSEAAIFSYVRTQLPNCTVLAVSHRVASLAEFDQIAVLDKGHIVDVGSPSELMERCELYRRLSITGDAMA